MDSADNKSFISAGEIKDALGKFNQYFTFVFPAMGWHFSSNKPNSAILPEIGAWTCMFQFIKKVVGGKRLCLSEENPGCSGATCYLGFKKPGQRAGYFLAEKERFKKSVELANAFYSEIQAVPAAKKYLILERIADLKDESIPEVIVLWVNPTTVSGLITLANYDRATNDNVVIPFASGCQSIWTIPFKEKLQEAPKCVAGLTDPAARVFMPEEVLSLSMPTKRFIEMAENIEGSFLQLGTWRKLHQRNMS